MSESLVERARKLKAICERDIIPLDRVSAEIGAFLNDVLAVLVRMEQSNWRTSKEIAADNFVLEQARERRTLAKAQMAAVIWATGPDMTDAVKKAEEILRACEGES